MDSRQFQVTRIMEANPRRVSMSWLTVPNEDVYVIAICRFSGEIKDSLEFFEMLNRRRLLEADCFDRWITLDENYFYMISKDMFVARGRRLEMELPFLERCVPYEVHLCGSRLKDRGTLKPIEESVAYVSAIVKARIVASGRREREYSIHVEPIQEYTDGAIEYKLSSLNEPIPLTKMSLGKWLKVQIPRGADIAVQVNSDFKKYYIIKQVEETDKWQGKIWKKVMDFL